MPSIVRELWRRHRHFPDERARAHRTASAHPSSYTRDVRMPPVTRLRRAVWIACACVLLGAPFAAAADHSLAADYDGDGKSDRVAIDRTEPSLLHVWLSTTGR